MSHEIRTPPNAILAAASSEILGREIGFIQWMGVGLPLVVVMAWFFQVRPPVIVPEPVDDPDEPSDPNAPDCFKQSD